jgi:hypothetical protein
MKIVSQHKFGSKSYEQEFIPGALLSVFLDEVIALEVERRISKHVFQLVFFTWTSDAEPQGRE